MLGVEYCSKLQVTTVNCRSARLQLVARLAVVLLPGEARCPPRDTNFGAACPSSPGERERDERVETKCLYSV